MRKGRRICRRWARVWGCIRGRRAIFWMRWWRWDFSNAKTDNIQTRESTGFFLDKRKPSYAGGLLEMANHRLYGFWNNLTFALRTGEMQSEGKGTDVFAQLYADPDRLKGFLRAMTSLSHGANVAIAKNFPWSKYKTAVDVGAAQGDLIVQVAIANPHIHGHRLRSAGGGADF